MAARQWLGAALAVSTTIVLAACGSSGTSGNANDNDNSNSAPRVTTSTPAAPASSAIAGGSTAGDDFEGLYTTTFTFDLHGDVALRGTAFTRFPGTCANEGAHNTQTPNFMGKVGSHEVHLLANPHDMPVDEDLGYGDAGVNIDGSSWAGKGHITSRANGTGVVTYNNIGSVTTPGHESGTVAWTCKDN